MIIYLRDITPWLQEALQVVTRLGFLRQNWDTYEAEAPNETARGLAREVLMNMGEVELRPTRVDASAEGGICISFVQGSRYADVECFNSGEVLAVTSSGDGQPTVWEVPATEFDIQSAVAAIQTYLNK